MRMRNEDYSRRAIRIRDIAPDFRLEDAWLLPVHGGPDDLGTLVGVMATLDPANGDSLASHFLFDVRHRIGDRLGWDTERSLPIPEDTEISLRARLPNDLRDTVADLNFSTSPFTPLYRTATEFAAELSNRTVHAVMHLVWMEREDGHYQGGLGVYVKPRGGLGAGYMTAIAPFRRSIVYPALLRQISQAWNARGDASKPAERQPPAEPLSL